MSDIIKVLYEWLGPRAVLLPIPFGKKEPVFPDWQLTTFERTQEPDYQEMLNVAVARKGNIGVRLTAGLVSLDIDGDTWADTFALKQPFSETLRSKGKRGCNFWFRMIGNYPNGKNFYRLKADGKVIGEWRCGPGAQTVIWGQHPDGVRYQRIVAQPSMELVFSDFPWPSGITLPWEKSTNSTNSPGPHTQPPGGDLHKRISRYMAKLEPSIAGARGDDQLFSAAKVLIIGWGLSQDEALPYLRDFNARCEPPWAEGRLLYKLKEADTKGQGERGHLRGSSACVAGGNVGNVGNDLPIEWDNPTNPTNPPGTHKQKAIYPSDSILSDFYDFAITLTEGADCYIIGSILPVCAAMLGRGVWLPWMSRSLHCNLFSILVGKPGDRKSSTVDLAEQIARACLPQEAFLPKSFSPETLLDDYDAETGGRPDKLLIADDANAILTDWQRSGNGERNAVRFLELYDCKPLSESYRRNRKEGEVNSQRRCIPFTSTSVVFGATFNISRFRNQAIQAGLQRRFLYYVAEDFGRTILYPEHKPEEFKALVDKFSLLNRLSGPFKLNPEARSRFESFQVENRAIRRDSDPYDDALLSRLASSPTAVLKVAGLFEACRSVYLGSSSLVIRESTLQLAIDHVEECTTAAGRLETIADRENTRNDAEVLLATVRIEYQVSARDGAIILSRTDLTNRFAKNGRRGLTVDDLYLRLIPHLIRVGQAKALPKEGKLERYAFRVES